MSENISLGKDETVIETSILSYSLLLSFIKSTFSVTTKRIICEVPNLFFIFPVGKNNVTFPLKNVAGVRIDNKVSLKKLIFGLLLALVGLAEIKAFFIFLLIGILLVLSSFEVLIVIQNNGSSAISYSVSPLEKDKAKQFVNELNKVIAENA